MGSLARSCEIWINTWVCSSYLQVYNMSLVWCIYSSFANSCGILLSSLDFRLHACEFFKLVSLRYVAPMISGNVNITYLGREIFKSFLTLLSGKDQLMLLLSLILQWVTFFRFWWKSLETSCKNLTLVQSLMRMTLSLLSTYVRAWLLWVLQICIVLLVIIQFYRFIFNRWLVVPFILLWQQHILNSFSFLRISLRLDMRFYIPNSPERMSKFFKM